MGNDMTRVLKALKDQGFVVTRTGKGHWLVRNGNGDFVTTLAGTPSEFRGWKNALAALKRAGLIWPPPRKRK
jgi:hypothetical protein